MKHLKLSALLAAFAAHFTTPVSAAPLDALLSANPGIAQGSVRLEAGYDRMSRGLDIFNFREKEAGLPGNKTGDYDGAHLRWAMGLTPNLTVDGAFWHRQIVDRRDTHKINTIQIGAQYRFLEASGAMPTMALRGSFWTNSASELAKSARTNFQGVRLDSLRATSPRDMQAQVDLLASWELSERTQVNAFIGAGTSKVSVDTVSATATQNRCAYDLAFQPTQVVGTLSAPCNGLLTNRFTIPNAVYGVNVYDEAQYTARFVQGGFSTKWKSGNWQLRGGYQFQVHDRDGVDSILAGRGENAYKVNHILVGEVAYNISRNVALFGRAQIMHRRLVGEIPMLYNTFTASRFERRYGFFSAGVIVDF